jgi:hypothetical protein
MRAELSPQACDADSPKRSSARIMRMTTEKARPEGRTAPARKGPTSGGKGRLNEDGARADNPVRVLFVCRANVCRSPMAEAIFNAVAEDRKGSRTGRSARGLRPW